MSRIFDALRKSDEDRTEAGSQKASLRTPVRHPAFGGNQAAGDALSQVPTIRFGQASRLSAETGDQGSETFRVLHHRLELIRRRRPLQKLLVTSAVPKEGKTTVACRLAAALARSSARVLLIDADLRHPGVHRVLGIAAERGLADWLEHREELAALLRRIEPHGVFYLPAGQARANPGELLREAALGEFLASTAADFDWVVVDSPPIVPFVDAHHLATLVDGVLVVLRCGVTPRWALDQVFASLERVFVAGAILNGAKDKNRGYYRYYGKESRVRSQTAISACEQASATGAIQHG